MTSPQDKRYISEKAYAQSTFIAQLCYTKFKFIGKAYYATHVQNYLNSHWMSGYLVTYQHKNGTVNISNFHLQENELYYLSQNSMQIHSYLF